MKKYFPAISSALVSLACTTRRSDFQRKHVIYVVDMTALGDRIIDMFFERTGPWCHHDFVTLHTNMLRQRLNLADSAT